ncbi:MAG TPA: ABC transporter ATP-binding protein, partial [Candidatus Brachybacterium intestinipullorum]|nr:ABC transporter ATP-binding protein [Candidatus Brachybacterium intestinipullorum]
IAHRFSTIRHADQILVLQHGRILERGTYDELVGRGGLFAQLALADARRDDAGSSAPEETTVRP